MPLKFAKYRMDAHGAVLAGRDAGRAAGLDIRAALRENEALALSFADVEVASPSYLDEVVKAARAELAGGDTKRWLIVGDLAEEDVREALEMVLERNKMTLAALDNDTVALLGGSAHLAETLAAAREFGEFRVPELAERLAIKMPALHQRLQALLEAGAIARTPDPHPVRGRSHTYTAPDAASLRQLQDA